jgi:hypothetical protein
MKRAKKRLLLPILVPIVLTRGKEDLFIPEERIGKAT